MELQRAPHASSGHHRRYVLTLLFLMVLLNIAIRYPLYHPLPHGSDSFMDLDLAKSLADEGEARWVLNPLSYFGMYPLSYPSGAIFTFSELEITAGVHWNSVPWLFGWFFAVLLVLSGFMLFRTFRIPDGLSTVFAGLMGLSPYFLFFSYAQASTRGFVLPFLVLGIFLIFWNNRSGALRILLFVAFTAAALTMHRSAFVILVMECIAGVAAFMGPFTLRLSRRAGAATYLTCMGLGAFVVLWPFIPGLREFYMGIPEVSSSFRVGELEFRTGFFLEGDSSWILLANLASNYVGSIGLILLLSPLAVISFYRMPTSSREGDIFVLLTFVMFSFWVWRVQYIQLLIIPFFFLIIGLTVDRWSQTARMLRSWLSRCNCETRTLYIPRVPKSFVFSVFVVLCLTFSVFMLAQRGTVVEASTNQLNWPSDSVANTGLYLKEFGTDDGYRSFVSNSGLLDRRIRWFSGWDTPVVDAPYLRASGYLGANSSDYLLRPEIQGDYLAYLLTFYKIDRLFLLNSSVSDYELYRLSAGDPYGILRLYFEDPHSAQSLPRISTSEAGIGMVVEMNLLGDQIRNPFTLEGTITCGLLSEVHESSYAIYRDCEHSAYLMAIPSP